MDIEQMTRGQIEAEFAALARTMYFTKSTIAAFSKDATRGQLVAACELIRSENATREENRKARLMRQAKFPAVKSVADFDFGEVSFPDGYTVDDLVSLEFVRQAQDFVFYGGCGRGKTHLATALGMIAVERGRSVRFRQTAELVLQLGKAKRDGALDSLLKDLARADAEGGRRRQQARAGASRHSQGGPADNRRVRLHPDRHRGRSAALPGDVGNVRDEEHDRHNQHRVRQMGHCAGRRAPGHGDD